MRARPIVDRIIDHVRENGPTRKVKLLKAVLTRSPNGADFYVIGRAVKAGTLRCDETGVISLPPEGRQPLQNDFADDVMEALAPIEPAPASTVLRAMGRSPTRDAYEAIQRMIDDGELREAHGNLTIAGG